jgi:hypothetical protein
MANQHCDPPDPIRLFFEVATKVMEQLNALIDDPGDPEKASRLLGKSDSLPDALEAVSSAMARVLTRVPASHSNAGGAIPDDQEIQQRIAAELDRIAARTGEDRSDHEDRADTGSAPAISLPMAKVAGTA